MKAIVAFAVLVSVALPALAKSGGGTVDSDTVQATLEQQFNQDVQRDEQAAQVAEAARQAQEQKEEEINHQLYMQQLEARYQAVLRKNKIAQGDVLASEDKGCRKDDQGELNLYGLRDRIACTHYIKTQMKTCEVTVSDYDRIFEAGAPSSSDYEAPGHYSRDGIDCRTP